MTPSTLPDRLAGARPVLLDGGLATTLEAGGADLSSTLWSARLLIDAPERITAAHLAFLNAGAEVLVTASYQASLDGLLDAGLSRAEAVAALERGVTVARTAVDRWRQWTGDGAPRWIAGSIGPFGAARADGSEYTGAYHLGEAELRAFHAPRLEAVVAAGADVLAIETQPRLDEAVTVLELARELGATAWVSFTTRDGQWLPDGTPLGEALATAVDGGALAVGVNCCPPRAAIRALERIPDGARSVVYPNLGDEWDPVHRQWRRRAGGVAGAAGRPSAASLGADLLGGCCGTAPEHIAALASRLAG